MSVVRTVKDFPEDLRRPCRNTVPGQSLEGLRQVMRATLNVTGGLGIAAPQVYHPLNNVRMFCVAAHNVWPLTQVSPFFVFFEDVREEEVRFGGKLLRSLEGCLSLPGEVWEVERWSEISFRGRTYADLFAIVIQHELDHTNGILISDKGRRIK